VLISGTAGTGKTSFAAAFADAACRRGERCLFLALEEAPAQIVRNMASIGLKLRPWVQGGRLRFHAVRSTLYGLEQHLVAIHKHVSEFRPHCVVIDPITNLTTVGDPTEITSMMLRVIDFLKQHGVTAVFTSLTTGGHAEQFSEVGISSLMDTWLLLRQSESGGDRARLLYILKSRGMAHSSRIREFRLTNKGIHLEDGARAGVGK
jgi:circadian clock protein KaiC